MSADHGRRERLVGFLRTARVATAAEARQHLGISQPTFSRLVATHRDVIGTVGAARATRYFARREIPALGPTAPLYDVRPDGRVVRLGELHATRPEGYYLEATAPPLASGYHDDLPWFLYDLRPAGFLGRLVPRRHPDLALPDDIRVWSGDDCLRYLTRHGWDGVGSFIVGDDALSAFLGALRAPPARVSAGAREEVYPRMADDVLTWGVAGSSAAGEQPKLLATRAEDGQPVLVKFSPPLDGPLALRVGDLLLAEHLALETLAAHDRPAARSRYDVLGARAFLEVERFDRVPPHGRRGVVSLMALDAEFGGPHGGWAAAAEYLHRAGHLPAEALDHVRFLARFGQLVANTDMHHGNLSFFLDGLRVTGACPAYDMTPMRYAPRNNQLPPETPWVPPAPDPRTAAVEAAAQAAARDFWGRVAADERGSAWLRATAADNRAAIADLAPLLAHLPRSR